MSYDSSVSDVNIFAKLILDTVTFRESGISLHRCFKLKLSRFLIDFTFVMLCCLRILSLPSLKTFFYERAVTPCPKGSRLLALKLDFRIILHVRAISKSRYTQCYRHPITIHFTNLNCRQPPSPQLYLYVQNSFSIRSLESLRMSRTRLACMSATRQYFSLLNVCLGFIKPFDRMGIISAFLGYACSI